MKNFKKFTAFVLALCMVFSLSISAFAAEKEATGYLTWTLDGSGTLYLSGNGRIAAFQSADDQPWHELRESITSVRFDPGAHMVVPDAAYWFSGCTNLKSCILPSFTNLGADTFKDCASLTRLQLYYNDETFYISDTAFSGVDMAALEIITCDEVTMGILVAKGIPFIAAYPVRAASSGLCGVSGCNCSSCSFTYDYEQKNETKHYAWECCTNCSANEYAYRHTESHSFNSRGVCTKCGYEEDTSCQHDNTYTSWDGCDWEEICRDCGETIDWGTSHGSYSYGDWEYYSSSQHRRSASCSLCGYSGYAYANHSFKYGSWANYSDTQHKRSKTCSVCKASSEEYADHVDSNGDGKCDDCGATVSLTVKWDAGTNGGTIEGKASITTTAKPNAAATAPTSTPVKTGHAFKGWYTSTSGGSLYNTVTITVAKTFYAQFTANSYTITWDLGDGNTETTKQTYGEKLVLPNEPTRKNAEFLGGFTDVDGGDQVTANDVFTDITDKTYYAHWEITEVFSVTVPVTLPLVVDESGEVHTGSAEIINASTGAVVVSSVSISTKNGWQLVPFATDMAHEKVDAKLLGFQINDAQTSKTGNAETFSLTAPWQIAENGRLPINYDAVVSAVSQPVTEQDVLSVVFVLEWKEV